MSTYQYYEFQAIDRPLTPEEQEAVARLSSRVSPHPWRAVFVYHWSGFPGRAKETLAEYYDAMLYMANWGSRRLVLRFPRSVLDLAAARIYCQPLYVEEFIALSTQGEHVILDIEFDEEGGEWVEGEGWLDVLIPLRDDILRGDYRALYLIWLKTLAMEDVLDSVLEPPVPAGLGSLSPALRRLIEFFEIDPMLVEVAAEASGRQDKDLGWLRPAISRLSKEESDAFLLRLAQGEPHLAIALQKRLRELIDAKEDTGAAREPRRTVGQLLAAAKALEEQRHQEQVAKAEALRLAKLKALAQREEKAWQEADTLIRQGKALPASSGPATLAKGSGRAGRSGGSF